MAKKIRRGKNKVCQFCRDDVIILDYKQVDVLRSYTTEKGKILPRRITGCCAKHQRMLASTVKRARHAALMPFAAAD